MHTPQLQQCLEDQVLAWMKRKSREQRREERMRSPHGNGNETPLFCASGESGGLLGASIEKYF
ncbi:hypothetical protein E2C01_094523 [Portunus trituberculatus]|uniref:Uncharacterized protein n=1 Tax=Portunus trituberculatus TaxID=210409 RepID=A0A5B7K0X6_PORTR|nr:hypothetical protein [Portunus trituberculatus]